jgi:hypothetical protein
MIKTKYKIIFLIIFLLNNIFAKDKYYVLGLSSLMSARYDVAEIMLKSAYLNSENLSSKDYDILTKLGHTYFLDQGMILLKNVTLNYQKQMIKVIV